MDANQFEQIIERLQPAHENAFERHAQTALTSLIVLLLAGVATFVFRMSDNQDEQLIEMRVLQFQVKALADEMRGNTGFAQREVARLDKLTDQIWPRLRAHGENIEVIHRKIEELCGCEMRLNDPDKF